jgi:hypothetical protein
MIFYLYSFYISNCITNMAELFSWELFVRADTKSKDATLGEIFPVQQLGAE